jgi:hypothetical protein
MRKKLEKIKNLRLSNWEILQLNFFKYCIKNNKLKKNINYKARCRKIGRNNGNLLCLKKLMK